MNKISGAAHYKSKKLMLVAALIFVSASPIFEIASKIIMTLVILFFIYIRSSGNSRISKYNFVVLGFILFIVCIYGIILDVKFALDISPINFGFAVFIVLGFLFAQRVSRINYLLANEFLVKWTLIIGLPIFLIIQIFPGFISFGLDYSYGKFFHKTFFVVNILVSEGVPIQRFTGFGSEPGLTVIFYSIALSSRLFGNKGRIDLFSFFILAAVFLSKSTMGMIVCMLLLVKFVPFRRYLRYLVVFVSLTYYVLLDEIEYQISYKLIDSDSFAGRYDRYGDFFDGQILNILFGFGNSYYTRVISAMEIGGWDSFLQVSQRYGLLFVCLLFFFIFNSNKYLRAPLSIIILLGFFTQSIWILPAIAYFYFRSPGESYVLNKR